MPDRAVKVYLKGDTSDWNRAVLGAAATAKAFTKELDTSNDRAALLTQSLLAVGPALVPIGATGIPIVAGLTNQFALAAVGAGTAALAFSGVGDALKAVNDYAIEPTEAHFQQMVQTMNELGPAGRDFVLFLQDLRPRLQELQDVAQAGLLPGVEEGISDLLRRLPDVEHVIATISSTLGELASEAGANLADPRWDEFFDFLATEGRTTLLDLGRSVGNLTEGFAELWMAFQPLSSQFSDGLLRMSRDFNEWAAGLDQTEGFQDFLDYIDRVGPKVWDTLGAIGNALLQLVEAAAPVGEAALPVIEAFSDAVATLADSNLGPLVIGLVSLTSAYSRLVALSRTAGTSSIGTLFGLGSATKAARDLPAASRAYLDFGAALSTAGPQVGKFATTSERLGASLRGSAKLAGGVGLLAASFTGLDDKAGLANTSLGAMAGLMATGGPWGLAIGAGVGLLKDLNDASTSTAEGLASLDQSLASSGDSLGDQIDVIDDYISRFEKVQDSSGIDLSDAIDGLEDLRGKRVEEQKAARDQAIEEAGLSASMANASDATKDQTYALLENIRVKNEAADAAENIFSAETNYRRALKDAEEQGKRTNAGIKGSSKAALDNRDSLDKLASAWNRQADAGGQSAASMRRARKNFIDAAVSMGVSREEARKLANQLLHIPSPHPKVVLEGVNGALTKLQHVKDRLLSLDGTTARTFVQVKESIGKKDGDLIRKFDSGGFVSGPGGPRDDLVPAMLSDGEFVVNAAATSRHLSLLREINANRYAGGGFVAAPRAAGGSGGGSVTAKLELAGVRVGIDEHGIARFVQGQARVVVDAAQDYQGAQSRRGASR